MTNILEINLDYLTLQEMKELLNWFYRFPIRFKGGDINHIFETMKGLAGDNAVKEELKNNVPDFGMLER